MPAKDHAQRLEANRRYRARMKAEEPETYRERRRRYNRRSYQKNADRVKAKCAHRQREHLAARCEENKTARAVSHAMLAAVDPEDAFMTYDEIAERLGITRARVGQLVASALRKLRARHPELAELLTGEPSEFGRVPSGKSSIQDAASAANEGAES